MDARRLDEDSGLLIKLVNAFAHSICLYLEKVANCFILLMKGIVPLFILLLAHIRMSSRNL